MDATPLVLIVEDDPQVLGAFADALRKRGHEVLTAADGASALRAAQDEGERGRDLHVVLLDIVLPDYRNSLSLIEQLRRYQPRAEYVPMTAKFEAERPAIIEEAFRSYGVYDFLEKPMRLFRLECAVKRALRAYEGRLLIGDQRRRLFKLHQKLIDKDKAGRSSSRDLTLKLRQAQLMAIEAERVSELIIEAGHRLLGARDVGELLRLAVDTLQSIIPSEAVVILFRESVEDGPDAFPDFAPQSLTSLTHKIHLRGGEIERPQLEEFAALLARDVATSAEIIHLPRRPSSSGRSTNEEADLPSGVRSVLCSPLVTPEHGVIGVLELINRIDASGRIEGQGFSSTDVRVLPEIASFLSRGLLSYHEIGRDPLTQLPNRSVLRKRTETEIRNLGKSGRAGDLETWFAIADVDHFRKYNEISGYLVADGVLQDVARTLRDALRDDDFVARYGGEEFCIILPRIENREQAVVVLDRIRKAISKLPVPNAERMPNRAITVSLGATRMRSGDIFRDVFDRANVALVRSKGTRNTVSLEPPAPGRKRRKGRKAPPEQSEGEAEDGSGD